ncbi:unnamed protein product, partial [marine sediment metagenome]
MQQAQEQQKQNGKILRVIPCYDELITFLKLWFSRSKP